MRKFMNVKTGEIISFFDWNEVKIVKYLNNKNGRWKEVFSNE